MINKSSETLAYIIVAYRSLGLFKSEARDAMIELMRRKESGDNFDYEQFITLSLNSLPKPEKNTGFDNLLTMIQVLK